MLKADGFNAAVIGVASRCGQQDILAYDINKCIQILEDQGMEYEDAVEYFEFNVLGAWLGDETPVFIDVNHDE